MEIASEDLPKPKQRYTNLKTNRTDKKKFKRLSESESSKALEFLKNEGRFWPNHIVAKYLGLRRTQIYCLRKRNNLKFQHSKKAMKDPVYREWYELKKHKLFKQREAINALKNKGRFWTNRMAARRLKCSTNQIKYLRRKYNLHFQHSEEAMQDRGYKKWYESKWKHFTTSETKFIRKHTIDAPKGARLSASKLAKLPEMKRHTKESIAVVIKRNHWADTIRSEAIKSAKRLSKYKKRKLLEFLKNEGRFWPNFVVAKHFGYSIFQVSRLRRSHNLILKHGDKAMQDPVYREWYKSKAERKHIKRQEALEDFLEIFVKKNIGDIKWKICVRCGKRWPATADFFRIKKIKFKSKLKKGTRYSRIETLCIACPAHKPKK